MANTQLRRVSTAECQLLTQRPKCPPPHCPRSSFQAPMDPHIVLGGFPALGSSPSPSPSSGGGAGTAFRNYSADATAFVVTLPLSSHPEDLEVGCEGTCSARS